MNSMNVLKTSRTFIKRTGKRILFSCEHAMGVLVGSVFSILGSRGLEVYLACVRFAQRFPDRLFLLVYPFLFSWGNAYFLHKTEPRYMWRGFPHGFRMYLDIAEKTQRNIYIHTLYETNISRCIEKNLNKGGVFVDVGANVGFFSLLAAAIAGNQGTILALEPDEKSSELFGKNVRSNDFDTIRLRKVAAGATDGEMTLFVHPLNRGGTSLHPFEEYKTGGKTYAKQDIERRFPKSDLFQRVRVRPLDVIMREEEIDAIDIIKIDVECFEEEAVKGMHALLKEKRARYVICELNNEESRTRVVRVFASFGYLPHRAKWDGSLEQIVGTLPSGNVVFM